MAEPPPAPFRHVPIRPDWLTLNLEAPLDPEREIVDAHHHLWDRPEGRYLLPDLLADLVSGHRVTATVFVQCRSMYRAEGPPELRPVGEVEFANGVAAMAASGHYGPARICNGIVGCADMTLGGGVAPVLDALRRAGPDRLRGIRFPVAHHDDPAVRSSPTAPPAGLLRTRAFADAARVLCSHGLSLDIWAYQTQLAEVSQLGEEVPDLKIILDHCGGPIGVGPFVDRRDDGFGAWRADMRRLARLPNLHVKLGGLAMRVGGFRLDEQPEPPSSERLAELWSPYIDSCIDLFGADRCMFESNFPVDKGMVSYGNLWNAFKRIAASRSEAEQDALFAGTARQVYRLPESPMRSGGPEKPQRRSE